MSSQCRQCRHFYITYKPATPYGCKIYQIESSLSPIKVIQKNTVEQKCLGHQAKKKKSSDQANSK